MFCNVSRLCSSNAWSPQATSFCLRATRKTYLVTWPDNLLFEFYLRDENGLTKICLSLFDFLCCVEVYKAKWLNSDCLNPSVKSTLQSFNGSVQCLFLTLACKDMDGSFLVRVYFVCHQKSS